MAEPIERGRKRIIRCAGCGRTAKQSKGECPCTQIEGQTDLLELPEAWFE